MISSKQSPYALLDEGTLTAIEAQATRILGEIGVELQDDPQSLEAIASLGARIEGERVYVSAEMLRDTIRKAPTAFTWLGQTKEASVVVGGPRPVFAPVFGPPNVKRANGEICPGTLRDYRNLVRLCDTSPVIDSTGFLLCIAHEGDIPVSYMELVHAHIELSDKPMMGTVISETTLRDVATEMGIIAGQCNPCRLLHMVNLTPPLVYQSNPLRCLRASAELGQATVVSSYMMMGATAPVTMAGALAQGLAETMVGLALTQIYAPGAPVVGGIFATPFSMQYMGPVFGTPESYMTQLAACQLVHRLDIPCRGDGLLTSSKLNDAQAGYEGASAMMASLQGGADLILHTAGWLEFGRMICEQKFASDVALLNTHVQ